MKVESGTYTTGGGFGAPVFSSTADITVSNTILTAHDSEAGVIEGMNSAEVADCDVTGNMKGTYGDASVKNIHNSCCIRVCPAMQRKTQAYSRWSAESLFQKTAISSMLTESR